MGYIENSSVFIEEIATKEEMEQDPLKAAMKFVTKPIHEILHNFEEGKRLSVQHEVRRIEKELESHKDIFPSEKRRIDIIQARLKILKKELKDMQRLERYSRFDPVPIRWRDENGFPRLVIFDLERPTFWINCNYLDKEEWERLKMQRIGIDLESGRIDAGYECCLTKWIQGKTSVYLEYFDVVNQLIKIGVKRGTGSVRLLCEFKSLLTSKAREEVKDAKDYFNYIFLLGEVDGEWDLLRAVSSKDKFLIIGYANKAFWFITSFESADILNARFSSSESIESREVSEMQNFNKNHPEKAEDEFFCTNLPEDAFQWVMWRTKRLGDIAYDKLGGIVKNLKPIFVKKEEVIEIHGDSHGFE